MSRDYNDRLYSRSYEGGLEKLKAISPERIMIKIDLEEIFGNFEYGEIQDVFNDVLKEGHLLEVSPGFFRVAGHTAQEMEKIIKKYTEEINLILTNTAIAVKNLVMPQVKMLKDFPTILFGIQNDSAKTAKAIAMNGIILSRDNKFWDEASVIILTPKGIFECSLVMSRLPKTNSSSPAPDWKNRRESPLLWLQYGEKAIREIIRYSK
ncbi:MAG: hypothetical protein Q7S19_01415 [bacterium]|nr:hypothetical protein [bacterium]